MKSIYLWAVGLSLLVLVPSLVMAIELYDPESIGYQHATKPQGEVRYYYGMGMRPLYEWIGELVGAWLFFLVSVLLLLYSMENPKKCSR